MRKLGSIDRRVKMQNVNKMGSFQIVKKHLPGLRRHRYVIACHDSYDVYENCPIFTNIVFYDTRPFPLL